ncbi:hypothetical protein BAY61_14035 [Prauserella marina]|nr:hypothetical protein BAY61_14035 [Prauserella marina]
MAGLLGPGRGVRRAGGAKGRPVISRTGNAVRGRAPRRRELPEVATLADNGGFDAPTIGAVAERDEADRMQSMQSLGELSPLEGARTAGRPPERAAPLDHTANPQGVLALTGFPASCWRRD